MLGLLFICLSGIATNSLAQDSSFDDLPLNGLAAFKQLRKEYYLAGLYLEALSQDIGSVSGKKRMEIRVTADKWSPRRFAKQWTQAILINNDQKSLDEFTDQILAFTNIPKHDLIAGDRIVINMDPNRGTIVYLNKQRMLKTSNNAFFDLLLNTWIGQRPPSSGFKSDIITLPTDAEGSNLLLRYEAISAKKSRNEVIAGWVKPEKNTTKPPPTKATKPAVLPPSSDGTAVTTKRSTTAVAAVAATTAAIAVAAPKPTVVTAKPKSTVATVKKPKPVATAKPIPKSKTIAKTKPVEKKAAKPIKPESTSEEQKKLMKTYRSNILKLTYLNTQYPKRAMDFKQQGMVILKIKLNRKGRVLDIVEEEMSDHRLLNKAAKKAVKRTAPYPEAPSSLLGDEIIISLPFNFKL